MSRKITLTIMIILMLFLMTAGVIVRPSYAVEWFPGDLRLTFDEDSDANPSVAQDKDGNIWVVWSSDRTGNNDIFYKVYDGSSWSDDTQLTTNSSYDNFPAIVGTSNGNIWVVWASNRLGIENLEIFYKVYDGSSWSDDTQLTTFEYYDWYPAIMEDTDGNIWVVWESEMNYTTRSLGEGLEIYYKVFNGSSWSDDMPVTTDHCDNMDPSIIQATGGMIWVAFTKRASESITDYDIYYKLFNGTSWSNDFQVTFYLGEDKYPSITQASDETIWVVWDSDRSGPDDNNIYYKVIHPYWSLDKKLTTDQSNDFHPSITAAADGTIWVVWTSMRDGNPEIYYRTTITSHHHDVAVIRVRTNPTIAFRGENVSIEVTTQNQGTYPETFQLQCHVDSTLIGSKTIFLSPGQTNVMYPPFKWNTTGVPRGIYTISATITPITNETDPADNYKEANEPVEIRILGDICGMYGGVILPIPNGVVDLDDFMIIAMPGHIFSEDPTWDPVWGPVCDVNDDGKVGVADLMIVGLHFGET